jgi:hypothetical protein
MGVAVLLLPLLFSNPKLLHFDENHALGWGKESKLATNPARLIK